MTPVFRPRKPRPGTPAVPDGDPEAVGAGEVEVEVEADLRAVAEGTGAATTRGSGFANSGVYIDRSVRQEVPHGPAQWPHLVGSPPGRALGFQERRESSRLRQALEAGGTAVVGQVLSGLGGVGKTQLAADYARTAFAEGRLDVLVWVSAASRQAVVDTYTRAAAELLAAEPDKHAAQRFVAWLQPSTSRRACRWLVVLDDLADPADMTGLWPPACAMGRTVVTTRRRDAALTGPGRSRVDVGVYTPDEAVAALHEALAARDHPAEPEAQIRALAEELGRLPLAVSQAAAYIADAALSCAAYRARLADRTRTLSQVLPDPGEGEALPDEQAATVAATWSLSVERADGLPPRGLARPILQLTSPLDPNGIPQTVLTSPPALQYLALHRAAPALLTPLPGEAAETREAPHVGEEDAVAALRALHRLSLLDHNPAQPHTTVRVHQLVQRVTSEALSASARDQLARTAADALLAAWPDGELDTARARTQRANSDSLADHAHEALMQPGAHPLLLRTGRSLGESGQVAAAAAYFQRLRTQARRQLGPDHPDTLAIGWALAHWQGEGGHPTAAVTTLTDVLAGQSRVLGAEHRDTLTTRHELAEQEGNRGRVTDAVTALTALLTDQQRLLGGEHRDTLTTRHSLIWWQWEAGEAAAAVPALGALLDDQLRVLGPDHADVLTTRHNLSVAWFENGHIDKARAVAEQLLADRLRINGADHPDTLSARHNVLWFQTMDADTRDGAISAYRELLRDRQRVEGPEHPDTLTTVAVIARLQGEAGNHAAAVQAHVELLAARERVLGPEHPYTLDTRGRLANWQGQAGSIEQAISTLTGLLEDQLRILGPDSPHTLATRHELAHWQGEAGDHRGAAAGLAALLRDRRRILGPDHADTQATRRELERWQVAPDDGDMDTAATE